MSADAGLHFKVAHKIFGFFFIQIHQLPIDVPLTNIMMDGTDASAVRLDTEFDQILVEMKPHVLRLPHKAGIHAIYAQRLN